MSDHSIEISSGKRFEFGKNWSLFLNHLNESRILEAEKSLKQMLGVETLRGKTFLDIGCGSGLFSLAACRLGANVHSFDYDPKSVACAQELRRRYVPESTDWTIEEGSVLDQQYMISLGTFDIVYSWGVLHHTGQMWQALDNARLTVSPGGKLFIAIYNDQGRTSQLWTCIKHKYNQLPPALRFLILIPCFARLWGPTILRDLFRLKPFHSWRSYGSLRGMSPWHDVVDWVGGYPFEVAKPEQIFDFYKEYGFELDRLTTSAGGIGCNEFVFTKHNA